MRKELKAVETLKRIRGAERRMHFEAGGTPEAWRGRSWTTRDRRKESNRKACRGPISDL